MSLARSLPLPFPPLSNPTPAPNSIRPLPAVVVPPTRAPQRRPARSKIWLALHCSDWPLTAALAALPAAEKAALGQSPLAVTDTDRQRRIIACNDAATHAGIRVGHTMNAAIALHATVQLLARDLQKEHSLLTRLARYCQRYSSMVCLEAPDELLIEIRGSLRLFGGLSSLLQRVRLDLQQLGIDARLSAAPTPQSALWLARASDRDVVTPRELRGAVDRLPIASLRWPPDIELRLWRFGLRTVGELLRLPRSGLARRIGPHRLRDLDRAFGRQPSVRTSVSTPETFKELLRLEYEVSSTPLLEPLLQQSLQRLARFLTQRQHCVGHVHISLRHRDQPDTRVTIGLARPTADSTHLQRVLHEKLHALILPAPVTDLIVRADRLLRAQPSDRHLFSAEDRNPQHVEERQARLYERLIGRLGEHRMRQLSAAEDHRPERAQHYRPSLDPLPRAAIKVPQDLPQRPRWLLSTPQPLRRRDLMPSQPPLLGPETVESGWWDGSPVHRDYFVARSSKGSLLWIFRDREKREWYVHGLFG